VLEEPDFTQVLFQGRYRGIGGDIQERENPAASSVFSNHAQSMLDGFAGLDVKNLHTFDENLSRTGISYSEDGFHQLGALCTHQATDAQDFTSPQREGNILEGTRIERCEVFNPKKLLSDAALHRGKAKVGFPAYHQADQLVVGQIRNGIGPDHFSIPHDTHFIGNGKDLFHLVGDVNHCDIVGLQLADDLEQVSHLIIGERAGRLVHHHHAAVVGDRLGDLTGLLYRDGQ